MCLESPGAVSGPTIIRSLLNFSPTNISVQNYLGFYDENGTSTGIRNKLEEERSLGTIMYISFTPFLVMLGVLGNLLSVFVFFKSKLRPHSTSQYLSALAISDSLFLIQLLPPWLSTIELNGLFHRNGFCQIFVYISYVACCVSAWLVVAFTVERFVAVQYPLHRNIFCTVTRARYTIGAIVATSFILNTPILLFAVPGEEECNINRDKLAHAQVFNWLDTTLSFTTPLVIIIILNTWIVIAVWKLQKERKRLLKQESRTPPPRPPRPPQPTMPPPSSSIPTAPTPTTLSPTLPLDSSMSSITQVSPLSTLTPTSQLPIITPTSPLPPVMPTTPMPMLTPTLTPQLTPTSSRLPFSPSLPLPRPPAPISPRPTTPPRPPPPPPPLPLRGRPASNVGYPRCQQRVTRMLLIVSSVFVFFNLPAYLMRVLAYVYDVDPMETDDKWIVLHHVSEILFNANFGINFFLYCLNGQNFRRALRQALPCCVCFGRPRPPANNAGRAGLRVRSRGAGTAQSFTTSAVSNGTDATSALAPTLPLHRRRRPSDRYILRWTFNNNTPRRRPADSRVEIIEMNVITPRREPPPPARAPFVPRATVPRPVLVTDRRNI